MSTQYLNNKVFGQRIFIKFDGVVANLYLPEKIAETIVIYCPGGPSLGDNGKSELYSKVFKKSNVALLIADYIGHCRSEGDTFSFENCIETIKRTEKFLKGKTEAINIATKQSFKVGFKKIILAGGSWGGSIVSLYHKYNPETEINDLILISPVTNWVNQGEKANEESIDDFWYKIKNVWTYIYRNIEKSNWKEITRGKLREFNPIYNIEHLGGLGVLIVHGNKDISVNISKSIEFYNKLRSHDPNNKNIKLKVIKNGEHGKSTEIPAFKFLVNKVS